jgi:hypothetical protein
MMERLIGWLFPHLNPNGELEEIRRRHAEANQQVVMEAAKLEQVLGKDGLAIGDFRALEAMLDRRREGPHH